MFQNTIDTDEEKSFSDAYRSAILNNNTTQEEVNPIKKLMFILLLVVLISSISILGYKYFVAGDTTQNNISHEIETERSISYNESIEEEQSVINSSPYEDTEILLEHSGELEDMEQRPIVFENEPLPTPNIDKMEEIAREMKLEMARELDKKNRALQKSNEDIQEIDTLPKSTAFSPVRSRQKGEEAYMKELAELSKEIDGEAK